MDELKIEEKLDIVVVPRYEYESMIERSCKLDLILGLIFDTATLSYDGKELRLGGLVFDMAMLALYPVSYQRTLEALRKEGDKE